MVTLAPTPQQHNFSPSYGERHSYDQTNNECLAMWKEIDRLRTYTNWPCIFMKPVNLAKAGFYYLHNKDHVRCAFCGIELGNWEQDDDPVADHQKWSDACPFLRGLSGNVPIEIDAVPVSSGGEDTCGKFGIEIRPNAFPERETGNTNGLHLSKLGVHPSRGPAYQQYVTSDQRLDSFAEWPRSIKQKPDELAAAGFFYSGRGDQTICFQCGGGLKDWECDDNPWEEHAKWFSKCSFVQLQKGPEYISEVCNKGQAILTQDEAAGLELPSPSSLNTTPVLSKSNSSPEHNKTEEHVASEEKSSSDSNTQCKICFGKEVGVVFLPCGHIVACVDCAPAINTCAVCRKPVEATVRAFLS